jgi:hypothetical protein
MAPKTNTVAPKKAKDLLAKLGPLAEIKGVQDYLLADSRGHILGRKPTSFWTEDAADAFARDMAQAGEIFRLLSAGNNDEQVFDFRFRGALLVVWSFGGAYLVVLCSEEVNLSIMRMTANVIKEELRADKRFRSCFARTPGGDSSLLTEEDLESDVYKHVAALKQT